VHKRKSDLQAGMVGIAEDDSDDFVGLAHERFSRKNLRLDEV